MKDTGNRFIRDTYYDRLSQSAQEQGATQPPLELPIPPNAVQIPLPPFDTVEHPPMTLVDAIVQRRSLRQYRQEALSMGELSLLLHTSQGITELIERTNFSVTLRTAPSAGARHAFETFLLINQVEGVTPGLYRYSALQHALVEISIDPGVAKALTQACMGQKQVLNSAVTFVWAAVVERMAWRYVERGFRYLFLDAGHVCQNVSIVAEAIDCGVCAIAAYDDEAVNGVLGLDGESQFAIYLAALGKKPTG